MTHFFLGRVTHFFLGQILSSNCKLKWPQLHGKMVFGCKKSVKLTSKLRTSCRSAIHSHWKQPWCEITHQPICWFLLLPTWLVMAKVANPPATSLESGFWMQKGQKLSIDIKMFMWIWDFNCWKWSWWEISPTCWFLTISQTFQNEKWPNLPATSFGTWSLAEKGVKWTVNWRVWWI